MPEFEFEPGSNVIPLFGRKSEHHVPTGLDVEITRQGIGHVSIVFPAQDIGAIDASEVVYPARVPASDDALALIVRSDNPLLTPEQRKALLSQAKQIMAAQRFNAGS